MDPTRPKPKLRPVRFDVSRVLNGCIMDLNLIVYTLHFLHFKGSVTKWVCMLYTSLN